MSAEPTDDELIAMATAMYEARGGTGLVRREYCSVRWDGNGTKRILLSHSRDPSRRFATYIWDGSCLTKIKLPDRRGRAAHRRESVTQSKL